MTSSWKRAVADETGFVRTHAQGVDSTPSDDVGHFPILGGVVGRSSLLALQRRAGNAAVSAFLANRSTGVRGVSVRKMLTPPAAVVQRCGSNRCDCAVEDVQTTTQPSTPTVQRQTAVGNGNRNTTESTSLTSLSSDPESATAANGQHTAAEKTRSAGAVVHLTQRQIEDRPRVQRQPKPAPADRCSDELMKPDVEKALDYLRHAQGKLAAPSKSTTSRIRDHFVNSDAPTVRYVQQIIGSIADRLRSAPRACHGPDDPNCGDAVAYVNPQEDPNTNKLVICPTFFASNQPNKVRALIHESAHAIIGKGTPLYITDRAYEFERVYGNLSPGEALTNADSYTLLVLELELGTIDIAAPIDTYKDCTGWEPALIGAIAWAQRWNRDALIVFQDRARLHRWSDHAKKYLGGQSPAQLDAGQAVYKEAELKLRDEVHFQCETRGGGRCDTSSNYGHASGGFHICPSLLKQPTPEDRAQELLAGLYGYYRIIDEDRRRHDFAALARNLHDVFYPRPTAAEVNTGLGKGAQPQPAAAPPP
jgi:hypothetical protein